MSYCLKKSNKYYWANEVTGCTKDDDKDEARQRETTGDDEGDEGDDEGDEGDNKGDKGDDKGDKGDDKGDKGDDKGDKGDDTGEPAAAVQFL